MYNMRFAVIGGDMRSIMLAKLLQADGNEVKTYGFNNATDNDIQEEASLAAAIKHAEVVIGPLPCSEDNDILRTPFHDKKILLTELFESMNGEQMFIAGKTKDLPHVKRGCGIQVTDILDREEMAVLNAIPTAEGAIQVAMEKMPITLHGSNALITGYGRIGKILAKMLVGIGANVYVTARKCMDFAWIESMGYQPIRYTELNDCLNQMDVVFNTVPSVILDKSNLNKVQKSALLVDLASKPGGVDFGSAAELGIDTVWALSLPGKVAPLSAAKYMRDTIYNIVKESGVHNAI